MLIVDDDPSIRQICREVLELGGYQVRDAGSATAALAEARRFRPDMILLDVLMPGIDGYRTAEMIRADPAIGDGADHVPVRARRHRRQGPRVPLAAPRTTWSSRSTPPSCSRASARRSIARRASSAPRRRRSCPAPTRSRPRSSAASRAATRSAVACYLDLDNLKAFNDYYGYAKANAVIRQTGDVIRHVVTRSGGPGDFIGHIAGDDFVFVTSADRVDAVCRGICERFDHLIRLYYDPRRSRARLHRDQGSVRRAAQVPDHERVDRRRSRSRARRPTPALAELAAVGKRTAKAIPGSTYVRDGQTMLADTATT